MTTIKNLISTVALIAASSVFAQSSNSCSWFPKDEDGPGVIGKRYAQAGFEIQDLNHTSKTAYDTGISANLPLLKGLDVSGSYNYSWFNPGSLREHFHDIGVGATLYNTIEDGVKPFISAGLGYSWFKESGPQGWNSTNDRATWGASVGAEFSYKWIAVIPTISYHDDFRRSAASDQAWSYGVEVNSWITSKVGLYVSLSYNDSHRANTYNSWNYGTGVRYRF